MDFMDSHDVIIVGSGPSGSAIANELTRAGVRCLMLEAANPLQRKQVP